MLPKPEAAEGVPYATHRKKVPKQISENQNGRPDAAERKQQLPEEENRT